MPRGLVRALRSWSRVRRPAAGVERPRARPTALIRVGFEVETVHASGGAVSGPLVVGRSLAFDDEPQTNGKNDPLLPGRGRRARGRAASSAARATSRPATRSWSRCPARCCPAASRSPRARPTATSPTA